MNEQQAIKTYLLSRPKTVRDIKWLMKWDEKLTIKQNTRAIGIPNVMSAFNFLKIYKLGSVSGYKRKVLSNKESLEILIENGLTKSQIARLFRVSPQRIKQLLEK